MYTYVWVVTKSGQEVCLGRDDAATRKGRYHSNDPDFFEEDKELREREKAYGVKELYDHKIGWLIVPERRERYLTWLRNNNIDINTVALVFKDVQCEKRW